MSDDVQGEPSALKTTAAELAAAEAVRQLTVNEQIQDAMIRHQIASRRTVGTLRNKILATLDSTEESIRAKLERRLNRIRERGLDVGPKTIKKLNEFDRYLRKILKRPHGKIKDDVYNFLEELAKREPLFVKALIEKELPVQVKLAVPDATTLRSIVRSRPFQGRVLRDWMRQFEANDRRRMMEQIRIGLVQGETTEQIGRRIFGTQRMRRRDGVRMISRRGADMLAETAVSHVLNRSRAEFARENSDLIEREIWVSLMDGRTSAICISLHGSTYPVGTGPLPPRHPHCRSQRHPIIKSGLVDGLPLKETVERTISAKSIRSRRRAIRSMIGPAPKAIDRDTFMRRQTKSFQEEVLGKRRAQLWRQGKVPLKNFIDERRNRFFTIDELMAREPSLFA